MIERKKVLGMFEEKYGVSIPEIEKFFMIAKIETTKEQIVEYLKDAGRKAGVDMDSKIEHVGQIMLGQPDTDKKIKKSQDAFKQELARAPYIYNGIDLKYYSDCFNVYSHKTKQFCMIARMIAGDVSVDEKLFADLDIVLDGDKVRASDVKRLFVPLNENYKLAKKTCEKANSLETYLKPALNTGAMSFDGVSYWECLPSKSLLNNHCFFKPEQYMAQTEKHKEAERESFRRSLNNFIKMLDD